MELPEEEDLEEGFISKVSDKEIKEAKANREELENEAKSFIRANKKNLRGNQKGEVVYLDFDKLAEHSPVLSENIINKPEDTLAILEVALVESELVQNARARLISLAKTQELPIREIRAKHLGTLISFEGIVRQASEVRPQVIIAKFECPSCGSIITLPQLTEKFREPSRCSCGRRGGFKEIGKTLVDAQRIVIEESSDSLKGGEQPKRMQIFLKEDLVEPKMEERTTPGARVKVIGILKEVALPIPTGIKTRFDLAIEANNIIPMEESFDEIIIGEEDEKTIKELAADPKIFEKIRRSIAPSVWGYPEIKEVLALQLFGGVKKERDDGTKRRGDLHILLMGDPGVAKSVMLKFISGIAPKGRYVSGKSASGAGLTATVIKDEFLRGWSLEAGAMVLSNKGLVCIDELEKMDDNDRSTMHEAMEQQTVTISKANVQATLRAQTAVLAAANPKYGRFNSEDPIVKQVNLDPPLLNRFDAIFILKDIPNKERDENIAAHVLQEDKKDKHDIIEKDLLRKYISYAKQRFSPKLNDTATEEIKKFYVGLREQSAAKGTIGISARQLEALIRMAEASAKIRLSKEVTKEDALKAISLMKFYLMDVGFDSESKSFDIDKISGISAGKRSKILMLKDLLESLETRFGKQIPIEEVEKEAKKSLKDSEFDEMLTELKKKGDVIEPRKGFLQRT